MYFPALVTALIMLLQTEAPYKASEEFKIELEYKFKPRPFAENSYIDLTETEREKDRRNSGGNPLPYLILHLSFQQLSDKEIRVRVIDNNRKNKLSKKAEINKEYPLDLGFTDDMKDRVTPYEFVITLFSKDKEDISRIVLLVEQDGTFLVNGVRRGKF